MSNMTPVQNLHYALGELAYSLACADGPIHKEEKQKFHSIVEAELRCKDYDFDLTDIIFQIMEKEHLDTETTYNWAMKEIHINSHYLSPELKNTFIRVLEKVAHAYPGTSRNTEKFLARFKADIAPIKGDPVFFAKKV
jgi:uncharacterized tellurite resistance protein B-like protein